MPRTHSPPPSTKECQKNSTKNKEGVRAIRATKYEKYMALKFTRAAHLWRKRTKIEYSSQKMVQQV